VPCIGEEQLQQALGKSKLADVKLLRHGVWVASSHRSVMCPRSKVFSDMFENETEEAQTGTVMVDDVAHEGLVALLEFLYLGKNHTYMYESIHTRIHNYVYIYIHMQP
jgi:hypothetical protein